MLDKRLHKTKMQFTRIITWVHTHAHTSGTFERCPLKNEEVTDMLAQQIGFTPLFRGVALFFYL